MLMRMRLLRLFLLSLCFMGCSQPQYVNYLPYHSDGYEKIKIALAPVAVTSVAVASIVDACGEDMPWNIAQELSNSFRYHAMGCHEFFLLSEDTVVEDMQKCGPIDFFDADLSFASNFGNADYLVALELIEHKVCYSQPSSLNTQFPAQFARLNSTLKMKFRLRVINLCAGRPKLALQEIFSYDYAIPKEGECINYNEVRWGSRAYSSTPWGKAHRRAICDLVARVEAIILELE